MEANQKKKFICKYCNKRFPCGKSLGGHIRTHMSNHNYNSGNTYSSINNNNNNKSVENYGEAAAERRITKKDFEGGGQSSNFYGLRENPKRTRRFADSNTMITSSFQQEPMFCEKCGKVFHSLKALSAHVAASHSENNNNTITATNHNNSVDQSSFDFGKQKLLMDTESDTETSAPTRPRRSKRMEGYKGNFGETYSSSCVSEIEQEQEEVAICLMMLSRDSSGYSKKGGLISFADSSDNNSVVLEAKSSSIDMRICGKNYGVNGFVGMKGSKGFDHGKQKSFDDPIEYSDNSDSGYFENGPKKVESDGSVDGFARIGELKQPGAKYETGFNDFGSKWEKKSFNKRNKNDPSSNPEFFTTNHQKKTKFECLTCNKVFNSHRSLWGHTAIHSRINGYTESINETGENSIENEPYIVAMASSSKVSRSFLPNNGKTPAEKKKAATKKNKGGHECPFCFRVFKSGQALGGHKRSHFVGGHNEDNNNNSINNNDNNNDSSNNENRNVVIKEDLDEMSGLIDLNLPAPTEEDAVGDAEFY